MTSTSCPAQLGSKKALEQLPMQVLSYRSYNPVSLVVQVFRRASRLGEFRYHSAQMQVRQPSP